MPDHEHDDSTDNLPPGADTKPHPGSDGREEPFDDVLEPAPADEATDDAVWVPDPKS